MRNYIKAFYTRLFAYNNPFPTDLQEGWFVGLSQAGAHGLAQAELPVYAAFDVKGLEDLGVRYVLLNKETLIGAFQDFRLSSGQSPDCHFHAFDRLATVEDLKPGESPRSHGDFPSSDGKSALIGKPKGGNLVIGLKSYLLLLLNTWSGVASGSGGSSIVGTGQVPQRWVEWLTLLINHFDRYTPSEIYGFLARVDFSAATFKV